MATSAWGFRHYALPVWIERPNVVSLSFEKPAPACPRRFGQFLVLRLRTTPTGPCCSELLDVGRLEGTYRVSVKRNERVVGSYLCDPATRAAFWMSARRGAVYSRIGDAPVVLLSAGIRQRPYSPCCTPRFGVVASWVWWIYGALSRAQHHSKKSRDSCKRCRTAEATFWQARFGG